MTKRQAELDQLKATRAKDLQTLKELASKYKVRVIDVLALAHCP